ncbi:MAG TPA: hypothetical protein VFP43_04680 [Mesorhizobium sp.]|nr:hypothetical protein [Mesorhizobium sp.]
MVAVIRSIVRHESNVAFDQADVSPSLRLANLSIVSNSNSRLRERPEKNNQSGNADRDSRYADKEKGKGPLSHILLGLQIVFGSLGIAIGVKTVNRAVKQGKEAAASILATDPQVLIRGFRLVLGYRLTLFGVFQSIDLHFPPSCDSHNHNNDETNKRDSD